MQNMAWILIAGLPLVLAGCGESVTQGERATAVDVVGEPADPTPDQPVHSDILGFNLAPPDLEESVTDSSSEPPLQKPFSGDLDDSMESSEESDINGLPGSAKPVSFKTRTPDSKLSK